MSILREGSSSISSAEIWGGYTDEINNELIIVIDSSPATIRRFDLNTAAQIGSDITTNLNSSTKSVVMVSSASAASLGTSFSEIQLIEVDTGHITNHSTSSTLYNSTIQRSQLGASDTDNNIAIFCSNSSRNLHKLDASTESITNLSMDFHVNTVATCIIFIGSDKWIVGCEDGSIYEIDSSGNIYKEFSVGALIHKYYKTSTATPSNPLITGLSYDTGMLLVGTQEGILYQIDYNTAELINSQLVGGVRLTLSNASSGYCVVGRNDTVDSNLDQTVYVVDFTTSNNLRVAEVFYVDGNQDIISAGINTSNNKMWVAQEDSSNEHIHFYTLIPRDSTTRNFNVQIGGEHVKCRLILIDDTTSIKKVILDTLMQSPATYRVPTGKNIIEIIKYREGTNALWGVGEYST